MSDIDDMIKEINDGIVAVRAAKAELKERTKDLVSAMQEQGKTREWAVGYIDLVCKTVDRDTAAWTKVYFEYWWPATDE